ncbi:MAG: Rrf2 family transcriptional regulator [Spirochaetales bacterium]|nr:Rrf2 family transcriptional regulator [Spirochaetales bacterium]
MRVTTKGRYALRAIVRLTTAQDGKPVSIRSLSEVEGISPEFLEQIFFKLRKAGLITSTRGPGGGFMLNRDPAKITVADIFLAVGEGLALTPCTDFGDKECELDKNCSMHEFWSKTGKHMQEYFSKISIKSIINDVVS